MTRADQLILAAVAGAVLMLCLCILFDDLKLAAHAGERMTCRDEPDRAAWMGRRPGEAHSVESCIKIRHIGDPNWVPILGEPTIAGLGVRGKLGLEQQLGYVRIECRKLAKQLNQRC